MRRNLPYNSKLVERARELRKMMTPAEIKLWNNYLRLLPIKVYRQRPIDNFIVDFYIPKAKIVIELDGNSHFTIEGKARDAERTAILRGHDLEVFRFNNDEITNDFEDVCKSIDQLIESYVSGVST